MVEYTMNNPFKAALAITTAKTVAADLLMQLAVEKLSLIHISEPTRPY